MGYHVLAQYVLGIERARSDKLATTTGLIRRNTKADLLIDGYTLGYNVSKSYASGLADGGKLAVQSVYNYTGKIKRLLTLAGSPEYYHARLAGQNVGLFYLKDLVGSLLGGLPHVASAVGQVATTLVSSFTGMPAMGFAGAAVPSMGSIASGAAGSVGQAAAAGVVNNYNLNVTGRLPMDDAKDAVWELRRLAGIKKP
jgi:hypothetical protein